MIEATLSTEKEFLKNQIGQTVSVLFETYDNGYIEGYTKNYSRVKVKSDLSHSGEILKVKLTEAQNDYCIGQLI
jgi:threonylcarbamoyladenosine tRNA methylthiotransferase MtaB